MTPSELKEEMGFAELCNISTRIDLPERDVIGSSSLIVTAAERLSAIDKQRAVDEGKSNIGKEWERSNAAQQRVSYSLFCQAGHHHNCHSMICACVCHKESKENVSLAAPPAKGVDPHADAYWKPRLTSSNRPVGTTQVGSVGWKGYANDPAILSERGVQTVEGSSAPVPIHKAGEILASNPASERVAKYGDLALAKRVEHAFSTLDRLEKEGRSQSGEAKRLQRMLLHSSVEPGESNWKSANRAIRLAEGEADVKRVIAPSRIQTCPFPSSREIVVVDDTGNSCRAYVPAEELERIV